MRLRRMAAGSLNAFGAWTAPRPARGGFAPFGARAHAGGLSGAGRPRFVTGGPRGQARMARGGHTLECRDDARCPIATAREKLRKRITMRITNMIIHIRRPQRRIMRRARMMTGIIEMIVRRIPAHIIGPRRPIIRMAV